MQLVSEHKASSEVFCFIESKGHTPLLDAINTEQILLWCLRKKMCKGLEVLDDIVYGFEK